MNQYLRNKLTVRRLLGLAIALLLVQAVLTARQLSHVKRLTAGIAR